MSAEESHRKRILEKMVAANEFEDRKLAASIQFGKVYLFKCLYNQTVVHELLGIVERVNFRTLKTKIISTDSKALTDWAINDNGYHSIPYLGIKTYKELDARDLPLYINHIFTGTGKKLFSEISSPF